MYYKKDDFMKSEKTVLKEIRKYWNYYNAAVEDGKLIAEAHINALIWVLDNRKGTMREMIHGVSETLDDNESIKHWESCVRKSYNK